MAKFQFKVSKKLILSITYTSPTYYIHIEKIFMRRYDKLFNKFLYVNIINVLCSTSLPAETRLTVYRRLAVFAEKTCRAQRHDTKITSTPLFKAPAHPINTDTKFFS